MIQYVTKYKANYCIVHKVDRLARNRADVTIHLVPKDAGLRLVSAMENIDETPRGCCFTGSCRRLPSSPRATWPRRSSRVCRKGRAGRHGVEKPIRAHYAGAVPLELLNREQDRIAVSLETIQNRIDAHHGEYAFACANRDDSLALLSNAADIYKTAVDANRRLCNQALFKAIYVDEDNDVRVGYKTPYDGLSIEGLQADALTWAAEARKLGQARTSTKGGPLVMSSNLTHLG